MGRLIASTGLAAVALAAALAAAAADIAVLSDALVSYNASGATFGRIDFSVSVPSMTLSVRRARPCAPARGDAIGSRGPAPSSAGPHHGPFWHTRTPRALVRRLDLSQGAPLVLTQPVTQQATRRIVAPNAVGAQANRWFTVERHCDISPIANTAWTTVLTWRPVQAGTANAPAASTLWTTTAFEVRVGGHSSAVGNGDRWWRASVFYDGSSAASVNTLAANTVGTAPDAQVVLSGWTASLQLKGNGGAAGSLGGYCWITLHLGGGEGPAGESIEWVVV
jgi:hypothetical protein